MCSFILLQYVHAGGKHTTKFKLTSIHCSFFSDNSLSSFPLLFFTNFTLNILSNIGWNVYFSNLLYKSFCWIIYRLHYNLRFILFFKKLNIWTIVSLLLLDDEIKIAENTLERMNLNNEKQKTNLNKQLGADGFNFTYVEQDINTSSKKFSNKKREIYLICHIIQ